MAETISPEAQVLRQALENAQRRNTQLEQNNRDLGQQVRSANAGQMTAQEQAVDASIDRAKSAQALARQKWTELQKEGNFDEAGIAVQEMTEASSRLAHLEAQKTYLVQQRESMARQPQQQPSTDPLDGYPDAEKTWLREHPAYFSDPVFQARVNAAANTAVAEGHQRGTAEWFEAVNRTVHPDRYGAAGETRQPRQQQTQQQVDDGGGEAFSETGENNEIPGEHTRNSPLISATVETPEMRVGQPASEQAAEPQERAIGRGGNGISATAAAPSRRIAQLAAPLARGQAALSNEELETAIEVVSAIEPNNPDHSRKTPQQMAETYYAWAHHPSNSNNNRLTGTRRAKNGWSREAIIA